MSRHHNVGDNPALCQITRVVSTFVSTSCDSYSFPGFLPSVFYFFKPFLVELKYLQRIVLLGFASRRDRLATVTGKSRTRTAMAVSKVAEDNDDVFNDLDVDRLEVNVIESLCFNCNKSVSVGRKGACN